MENFLPSEAWIPLTSLGANIAKGKSMGTSHSTLNRRDEKILKKLEQVENHICHMKSFGFGLKFLKDLILVERLGKVKEVLSISRSRTQLTMLKVMTLNLRKISAMEMNAVNRRTL